MNVICKFNYQKGVASSTVNEIVSEILELHHKTPPNSANYNDYQQIANSKHLQDAYLERTLKSYVAPIQHETITDIDGTEHQFKFTQVPLKSILSIAFRNQSLVDYLCKQQQQPTQRHPNPDINSPLDGTIFSRMKGKIKIELYADDTQYSPGFFNNSQKFTCVYISLADVPFHYRTRSDAIDIYMLVNAKQLKNLNLNDSVGALFSVLRREIEEINQDGGIKLRSSSNECFNFEVTISTILGDNLAIYPMLGFSASFKNDSFICRFCSARGNSKDGGDDTQELFRRRKLVDGSTATDLQLLGIRPERGNFIFDGLDGINRWNVAPPDLVNRFHFF